MKTAFVLAGGGSLGALQVGMLQALAAHGVRPDLVVGSSVGAINGAWFAAHPDAAGADELARLWRGIRRSTVFPVTMGAVLGVLLRRDFLVSSGRLRSLISRNLTIERLEQAAVPLHVVATNVLSGETVVLSEGPAVEAILASCAIPAAFPPVALGGAWLADGAVTSNTPVRVAVELGARRLVILPTGYACALKAPPRGAIAYALHALTLLIARQLVAEIEALPPSIEHHIVPTLCPLACSPYDFSQSARMIEDSRRLAEDWIVGGGLSRREMTPMLRPHRHDAGETAFALPFDA